MIKHRWADLALVAENDVVVAAFPKSGNTWMQCIVAGIKYGIDASTAPDSLVQDVVPDVQQHRIGRRYSDSICLKTHHLPKPEYRKAIHLVRDPRDVLVSYTHYRRALGYTGRTIDLITEENEVYANWGIHTTSWLSNPYDAETILISYEQLLLQPEETISKIARFLEIETSSERVKQIIQWTNFSALRARENRLGWDNQAWPKDKEFFRKGVIGSFKEELGQEELDLVYDRYGDAMSQLGYGQ